MILARPANVAEALLDDGQRLLALNEIFVGHCSHQSARYRLAVDDEEERHSSSGLIVSTGTGATGWARLINLSRGDALELPGPTDRLGLAEPAVRAARPRLRGRFRGQANSSA